MILKEQTAELSNLQLYICIICLYWYRLQQCQTSLTAYAEENKKLLDINQKLRKQTSTVKLQHDQ